MVQRMMGWSIDDFLQGMTGDHIGIVNLGNSSEYSHNIMFEHTSIDQRLTRTNNTRYSVRCNGKKKMKRWYGTDCRYPSTGWKACEANGVGTTMPISLELRRVDNAIPSHL